MRTPCIGAIKKSKRGLSYHKFFGSFEEAKDWCVMKNKANRDRHTDYVITPGPGGRGQNFAVTDLKTAIELGLGYLFNPTTLTRNPWRR